MRIGNFEHKPSLVIVLLFLLFAAALLFLGTWQMKRAALKTSILAAAAESRNAATKRVADITDVTLAAAEHTRIAFKGTYFSEKQFLWDNRVHNGQAGYEVITPVRTESGMVLVNRGWVAPGRTRQDLPDIKLDDELNNKVITTTGLFSRPSKGFASGDAFDIGEPWPRVLRYFDYQAIEQALGSPVLAGVVQPQQKGVGYTDKRNTDTGSTDNKRPDYYTANWEPVASIGPERHYGYAFQWYAMAAALTILYIVYNTRRIRAK